MTEDKYTAVVAILGQPDATLQGQPPYAAAGSVFAWWAPVIDRTLADCVYGNPKGCIDSVVLNRIESDTEFIRYLLSIHHLHAGDLSSSDVVWHRKLYVLYESMERIRSNITAIRQSNIIEADTPEPAYLAAGSLPTYTVINGWERVLFDMYAILTGISLSSRPLGTFDCGMSYTAQQLYLGGE